MIAPRWKKVMRDIGERPMRTFLVVLAMAAGVFGIGTILTAYSILTRELATTYVETRPASAILISDSIADPVVESLRQFPGVADAEARPVIHARIRVGQDEWAPLILFVIRDFQDLRLDKIRNIAGAWPPGDDEILLERTAFSVARTAMGQSVTVKTAGGTERPLRVAGSVHAPGLAPAWMDHVVSGFVNWNSVMRADAPSGSGQLRILIAENRLNENHIREIAGQVKASIEKQGGTVSRIDVPAPGRHPHADQMDTFLFLLGAFGALTLCLSAVLAANMIHALLTEQIKQVGVMKALGAATGQIVAMYLGQVSILAAIALCIGIPLGLAAGRGYAQFSATILNANIANTSVPFWAVAAQVAIGIFVPLAVALGPVYSASRITIHEAFSGEAGQQLFGARRFDRWLARIQWLPRPLMLSLRAAFHRRGRLVLTVGTLALGGAVFISALNVSAAWNRAIAGDAAARRYDVDVRLAHLYPVTRFADAVAALPGVEHAEYWSESAASLAGTSGAPGTRISLFGPAKDSKILALQILKGRWLNADDQAAVVINQALLARDPTLRVGGEIKLLIEGRNVSWPVVGVAKEIDPSPAAYAPPGAILEALGQQPGMTRSLRVITRRHDAASQLSVQRDLERTLERLGVSVLGMQSLSDRRKAFLDHLVIIESALMFAGALVVLVGGLGLTSTLTLNVIERTREIGILGAIGAGPQTISLNIVFEGVLMAVLSWCMALVVAVPVTILLDMVTGQIFIKSSLDFFMSPRAAALWLVLVIILAMLSSFYPARRAAQLTVREALAYE
jgi:putative ABC transport system permease protein